MHHIILSINQSVDQLIAELKRNYPESENQYFIVVLNLYVSASSSSFINESLPEKPSQSFISVPYCSALLGRLSEQQIVKKKMIVIASFIEQII